MRNTIPILAAAAFMLVWAAPIHAQNQAAQPPMSFFVTSVPIGDGGNLGGLAGADRHCQALAGAPVHARDRIGTGPWYNARGALIARDVTDLHGDIHRDRNNINKESALDEKGALVKGRGDTPNQHDILTGSDSHGRGLLGSAMNTTCNNWTSNAAGNAMVGHHDRLGGGNTSWNAVHPTRSCSQPDLVATGGAGLFYCFAAS
jgi:hypothetical protein